MEVPFNIVGCYMLRRLHSLLYVVACCCELWRKVWNRSNSLSQQLSTIYLLFRDRRSIALYCWIRCWGHAWSSWTSFKMPAVRLSDLVRGEHAPSARLQPRAWSFRVSHVSLNRLKKREAARSLDGSSLMGRIHSMMHSKLHPCLELLHPFAHHRQHYPTTTNIFGLTNVESCYVCIIGNVFCCVIKLDIHKAATLGVSASVCLIEVCRSIEVCHKLAYSLAETSPFWIRRATKEALLVHNRSSTSISDCIPSSYFWNEAKLGVSSAWWPLYKGDNNGRALMIETAKRLPLHE